MIIPARQKKVFNVYRAKAGLSFKAFNDKGYRRIYPEPSIMILIATPIIPLAYLLLSSDA